LVLKQQYQKFHPWQWKFFKFFLSVDTMTSFPSGKNVLLISYSKADQQILTSYQGNVSCLEPADHGKISSAKDGTFDVVVSAPTLPFSGPYLEHILRVLKPGGYLSLLTPKDQNWNRSLTFGGFVDISSKLASNGQQNEVVCRRPPWSFGASAPLKKPTNPQSTSSTVTTSSTSKNVWQIAASDLDAEMELEDEDALLEKDDMSDFKAIMGKESDCGTGKGTSRKACKNCSCGRAEIEAEEAKSSVKKKEMPVSACGSCGLGDAFRCSTCPYLGQPPFKMTGDVVKLDL